MSNSNYFKKQILSSKRYSNNDKYLIEVLLDEDKQYSLDEVKTILEKEKKRGVK